MGYRVAVERPKASELAGLMEAVGWGGTGEQAWATSIAAYPCTICARDVEGNLVGYLSAFSDGVMSTMLGELVVHPDHRRQGVASDMLAVLEERFSDAHVYVKALGSSKEFYAARGYKEPKEQTTAMFKRRRRSVV